MAEQHGKLMRRELAVAAREQWCQRTAADLVTQGTALVARRQELDALSARLMQKAMELDNLTGVLDRREAHLTARFAQLRLMEKAIDAAAQNQMSKAMELSRRESAVEAREKAAVTPPPQPDDCTCPDADCPVHGGTEPVFRLPPAIPEQDVAGFVANPEEDAKP